MKERGKERGKRGLSPIIATVLLIVLIIIIALIIFLWVRSFVGEACEKQNTNAQLKCNDISLEASKSGTSLYLINRGNVPVETVRLKITKSGSEEVVNQKVSLAVGQSNSWEIPEMDGAETVKMVSILKGETSSSFCEYVCDSEIDVLEAE